MDKDKETRVASILVILIVLFIGSLILAVFSKSLIIASVGFGEIGVKFNVLGEGVVLDSTFQEGWSLKAPWIKVYPYNTKLQEYTMSIARGEGARDPADEVKSVTSEGLYVGLDITAQYRINGVDAPWIHKNIGPNYIDIVIRPVVRSKIREVISRYTAEEIYGPKRKVIEREIYELIEPALKEKRIIADTILLRNVELPNELERAIESKMTAEQLIKEQGFNIEVEAKLADQKRIEAQGIADANTIISDSLTPEYLTWWNIKNYDTHQSVYYLPIVGSKGYPEYGEGQSDNDNTTTSMPFILTKDIDKTIPE